MSNRIDALKVLIIEDNPGDAFIIIGLLQELDMPVDISMAKDGRDALNLLTATSSNGPPDLVILDLNLPRVNGYEVLGLIKSSPALKEVPVVVMTGSLNPEDEVRSRDLGAIDFCIKPATHDELNRTQSCLRGHLESLCHTKGARCGPKGLGAAGEGASAPYRSPLLRMRSNEQQSLHNGLHQHSYRWP